MTTKYHQSTILYFNFGLGFCTLLMLFIVCLKSKEKMWNLLGRCNSGSVVTIIWLASFFLGDKTASFTRISETWNSSKLEIKFFFFGIINYQTEIFRQSSGFSFVSNFSSRRDHNKEVCPIDLLSVANYEFYQKH